MTFINALKVIVVPEVSNFDKQDVKAHSLIERLLEISDDDTLDFHTRSTKLDLVNIDMRSYVLRSRSNDSKVVSLDRHRLRPIRNYERS